MAAAWLALDGDYDSEIGFKQELLTLQDSGFLATGTANFVDMTVLGQGETYLLHFGAAQGEQLKPGRYAVSVANRTGPSLGASISGLNGSCESEIGNFEVFDISMSRAGTANVVFVRFRASLWGNRQRRSWRALLRGGPADLRPGASAAPTADKFDSLQRSG